MKFNLITAAKTVRNNTIISHNVCAGGKNALTLCLFYCKRMIPNPWGSDSAERDFLKGAVGLLIIKIQISAKKTYHLSPFLFHILKVCRFL